MKNNLLARFAVIVAVLLLAVVILKLYPLKPGIDLAGGTSLLYEVQIPENFQGDPAKLAGDVITTLKKRIDPLSQKNLVWRVVGGRRIQLQIPQADPKSQAARKAFSDAETALRESAIKQSDIYAVTSKAGAERQTEIERIAPAMSSTAPAPAATTGPVEAPTRREILQDLGQAYDKMQAADKEVRAAAGKGDVPPELLTKKLAAQSNYNGKVRELLATNVDMVKLKGLIEAANSGAEEAAKQIKTMVEEYPAQKGQLENLLAANVKLQAFAGQNMDDPEEVQRLLQGSGKLDFRIAVDPRDPAVGTAVLSLREQGPRKPIGAMKWFEVDRSGMDNFTVPNPYNVVAEWGAGRYVLLFDDPDHALTHEGTVAWKLTQANRTQDSTTGQLQVAFQFDGAGQGFFADLTTKNVGRPMAILLDDRAISAPNIHTPITGGSGVITFGSVSATRTIQMIDEEASNLVQILNAGSLQAALSPEPISVVQVSPTMGKDNIDAGFRSAMYAFLAVVGFMVVYYTITGLFADLALMLNLVVTLAAMALMGATFTLPGIAGIVLTLGMAVDANVLINERIREEVHKGGSLWLAVKQGYDKVFWTIFDANLTTSLTSIVLIFVGSEEVKGFGVTLLIGLIIHMFTALFVTRTLMIAAIRFGVLRQIDDHSVGEYIREAVTLTWLRKGRWPFMRVIHVTNIDWIGMRHKFWVVSGIITIGGLVAFFARGDDMYDTEFRGGTQVTLDLSHGKTLPRDEVERRTRSIGQDNKALADARDSMVQTIGSKNDSFQIETTLADTTERKVKSLFLDALAAKFADVMDTKLKVQIAPPAGDKLPTSPVDAVAAMRAKGWLVPLTKPSLEANFGGNAPVTGLPPRSVINYMGGVGMYITGIDPPQTASQLKERLDASKQSVTGLAFRGFDVIPVTAVVNGVEKAADEKETNPLRTAVFVTSDPAAGYEADPLKQAAWEKMAEQEWGALTGALESRSPFKSVSSIDGVVAGQAKQQALVAIILSLILIVIYVWVRFGGIRYGFGAILSLAHDAIVALAATVMAKYAAETWLGQKLLISDFKINLTMIAAYLTVIGYSVNDTIVIFDRIRENRGRLNHPLSKQLVNDSINQCFGRTIWTTFTVFIVVLIMYIWGGEGVRGFSYAMLIGVFTGAYSTLAIASPMLLNVKDKEPAGKPVVTDLVRQ